MKICIISDHYHPSLGGTQKLAESVAEIMLSNGHTVEIITTINSDRKSENYPYKIHELDELNFSKNNLLNDKYETVFVFADLGSLSWRTIQIDNSFTSVIVLNLDENVYNWIQNEQFGFNQKVISNFCDRLKSFSRVVSFCKGAPVNKFLEENGVDYTFIQNFTDDFSSFIKKDFDIYQALKLDKNKKIIFNHGLFEPRKNQLRLIEAFVEKKLYEDYSLVFLGSPRISNDVFSTSQYEQQTINYFLKCKKIIEQNGLEDNIKIIKGSINKELVGSLLNNSDLFVLPSVAEGLPLVLIEAMSCNLPWISTPVGGVPGVLGKMKSGIILEKIDFTSSNLLDSLEKLKNSNFSSSRKDWLENFSKETVSNLYLDLLRKNKNET